MRLRWWKGNGRALWAADSFYRSRLYREHGWCKDMLLIQACYCYTAPRPYCYYHILRVYHTRLAQGHAALLLLPYDEYTTLDWRTDMLLIRAPNGIIREY